MARRALNPKIAQSHLLLLAGLTFLPRPAWSSVEEPSGGEVAAPAPEVSEEGQPDESNAVLDAERWRRSRNRRAAGLGVSLGGLVLGAGMIPLSLQLACAGPFCDPLAFWAGTAVGMSMMIGGTVGTIISGVMLHRHRKRRPESAALHGRRGVVWTFAGTGVMARF